MQITKTIKTKPCMKCMKWPGYIIKQQLPVEVKLRELINEIRSHFMTHLSRWISLRSGSSHPSVHSQWASRNVITWPFDSSAPTTSNDTS